MSSENGHWLFQGNPKYFDLQGALEELDEILWKVNRSADSFQPGQKGVLWQAGADAGVIALAEIVEVPREQPMSEAEKQFVRDPDAFDEQTLRVRIRVSELLDEPLARSALLEHPVLSSMAVIRSPQGTNYNLTDEEYEAIALLAGDEDAYQALAELAATGGDADTEVVDQILSDAERRVWFGNVIATAIGAAHEANPNGWELSLRSNVPLIRLNAGMLAMLTAWPDKFQLTLPEGTSELLQPEWISEEKFSSAPEMIWVEMPWQDAPAVWESVRDDFLRVLRERAKSFGRIPFWYVHSSETVDYLADAVGQEIPQPEYLPDIERRAAAREGSAEVRPNYWKIAPGESGEQWEQCLSEKFIGIGWDDLGDLSGLTQSEWKERAEHAVANTDGLTLNAINQVWRFATRVKEGDYVIANQGTSTVLGIGRVAGPYYYAEGERRAHRRRVEWEDPYPRAVDQPGWRRTLIRIKSKDKIRSILEAPRIDAPKPPTPQEKPESPPASLNPDYSVEACAEELHVPLDRVKAWLRAIERKQQAVFYGPPGTGKTYVAQKLAQHLIAGGTGFSELVQFHPAYSYEDFVQGIRPESLGDRISYPMKAGRLLDFCRRAAGTQDTCVLIIDEINRANLARVFGELMYLLEYRDQAVPLAGGGTLRIPDNVRLIGTMNTADRSIALVDHALRRRFAFLPLFPDFDTLRRYHQGSSFPIERLVKVLEELNRDIDDRNYSVGISFFLHDLSSHLADIWQMEIEPYLEEYFFDRPERVDKYRWAAVEQRLNGT